jgi:hypothetical protein
VCIARLSSIKKKVSKIIAQAGFSDAIRCHVSAPRNHEHPELGGIGPIAGLTSIRHQSPHAPPMTCGNDRSGLHLIGARLFVMFPQVRGSTWQEPAPGMNN